MHVASIGQRCRYTEVVGSIPIMHSSAPDSSMKWLIVYIVPGSSEKHGYSVNANSAHHACWKLWKYLSESIDKAPYRGHMAIEVKHINNLQNLHQIGVCSS